MGRPPTQRVKRLLVQLMSDTTSYDEKSDILDQISDFFKEFPSLASQRYFGKQGLTFLHCFLQIAGKDSQIKFVSKYERSLLGISDGQGNLPIHLGCQYSPGHVIEILAKSGKPELLAHRNNQGFLPFDYAMDNSRDARDVVPFSTLQTILELYPPAAASNQVLTRALNERYPLDLLNVIVEALSKDKNNNELLKITIKQSERDELVSIQETQLICKLLDKHTILHLQFDFTVEAWVYLLSQLQTNRTISHIHYLKAPHGIRDGPERRKLYKTFQGVLQHNRVIKDMRLYSWPTTILRDDWMSIIQEGLASNKVLETIDIDHVGWLGFRLRRAATNTAAAAAADTAADTTTSTDEILPHPSSTNNSHHLTLQLSNNYPILDQGCRWGLLKAPRLFHLKTLYLHNSALAPEPRDSERCTTSIVAVLKEAKNLQKLTLFRYRLLWLPVLEVLKRNTHLQHFNAFLSEMDDSDQAKTTCLKMLQKHNVTLEECIPLNNCPKIDYLLQLNRLGRASARHVEESQLIHLLVAASNDDYLASSSARFGSASRATDVSFETQTRRLLFRSPRRVFVSRRNLLASGFEKEELVLRLNMSALADDRTPGYKAVLDWFPLYDFEKDRRVGTS